MPEYAERTSTEDVLQSSELAARLLRRLIASPGVIDTQRLFKTYARLTELITHAHPLLHDLLARYSVDDDSGFQNLPLVMDQPWMLNLNTYLTNNSSFSSTTTNNSFFAATNQFISPASTTSSTHTQLFSASSESQPSEKFRISRRPAGRRQGIPVDAGDVVLNPLPSTSSRAHVEGQPRSFASGGDTRSEHAEPALSSDSTLTNLTLARTPVIQRESPEIEMRTSRLFAKTDARIKDELDRIGARQVSGTSQTVFASAGIPAATPQTFPLVNKQTDPTRLRETVANSASENQPSIPLVQEHIPSSQFQTRPPQLVWRKSADSLTLSDLLSDLSSNSPLAAVRQALDSLPVAQLPQSTPMMKPESSRQEDEPRTSEEITTEGMLRRISRMLLIERERRGY